MTKVTHPGCVLKERVSRGAELDDDDVQALGRALSWSPAMVKRFADGSYALTARDAWALQESVGLPAAEWMRLQAAFELAQSQPESGATTNPSRLPSWYWGKPVATFWMKQRAHQRMRPQLVTLGISEIGRPLFVAIPQEGKPVADYAGVVSGVLAANAVQALTLVMPDAELTAWDAAGYEHFIQLCRVAHRALGLPWLGLEDLAQFSGATFVGYALPNEHCAQIRCSSMQVVGSTVQPASGWLEGNQRHQVCPPEIEAALLHAYRVPAAA